jgi:putative sigma-54 modulation protein
MEVEFLARNTEITEAQRDMARKKLKRLAKYFNAVHEARVVVTQEKHRLLVEAFIRGKDFEVAAKAETGDWASSLQEVVSRLEQQASRSKQKLTGRKRQSASRGGEPRWQVAVVAEESVRSGKPEVVELRHVPVVPMTVDEAALQLESSRDDFIVFREASTDRVNVLYRRRDHTYGLVTPEY